MLNIACMVTSATGSPTLPNTPACTDATVALGTNTQCTQALANINSGMGADTMTVCSDPCRGLLLTVFQNCPNEVCLFQLAVLTVYYIFTICSTSKRVKHQKA